MPPSITPGSVEPKEYLSLVAVDFHGLYLVYIAAAEERLKMLRLALSFLAAPFAAAIALVGAKVVEPGDLTAWDRVPDYLYGLVISFGILTVLPYLRMIEATGTHLRTARAMNNFRRLYVLALRDHFTREGWSPNLPVDPAYPETFNPTSWIGINALALAVIDSTYVSVGLIGLAGAGPHPLLLFSGISLATVVLFFIYYIRTNVSRRRRQPDNPFNFPVVET